MMRWFRKKQAPVAETASPQASSPVMGDMASSLSADALRPEAQSLLRDLAMRLMGTTAAPAPAPHNDTASDGMMALVQDLSRKLFPHRHKSDEASVDPKILLDNLREQLEKAPRTSFEDAAPMIHAAPSAAELDSTAMAILERSGMSAGEAASGDINEDATDTATAKLSGDTKPDHASPEALANPFSLVNINRGAASAIPIAPGADQASEDMTPKKKGRRGARTERSTVSYNKKLAQSRFSRRRFLRDYSGTNILTVIFMFILLVGVTVGTVVTNFTVLIPQTRINQDAGKQSESFRNEIALNEPKLAQLLQRRQAIDVKVEKALEAFVPTNQIREDFTNFIETLEDDPRVEVEGQQIEAIDNELPNVQSIVVSVNLKTTFLLWLKYRNQMIREFGEVNVIEENIDAPAGIPTVNVFIKMSRPGRT
ncbi:MAG: hypothetical protein J4F41_05005 [Alphaproteobacteria bacterium]|nr:hypothetical protein [Alphaproteobacteria bacterium]